MPEQPKVIRKRIRSVGSTQKITRTMEMVATAKLRAAQNRVASSGPYLEQLRRLMGDIGTSDINVNAWPQFQVRDTKRTLVFVVTANRGLCGAYNTNIVRLARQTIEQRQAAGHSVRLVVAGRKGASALRFAGYTPEDVFVDELLDEPTIEEAEFFLNRLNTPFLDREVDEVLVVYSHWESLSRQPPTVLKLFPIAPLKATDQEGDEAQAPRRASLFEPSAEAVLDRLLPQYERQVMYSVLAEAVAAEQLAKRMAMKRATDNASEMVAELTLQYNKARQALITQELAEIIGGAEALSG